MKIDLFDALYVATMAAILGFILWATVLHQCPALTPAQTTIKIEFIPTTE